MPLLQTSAPSIEPVTLTDIKNFLRVDSDLTADERFQLNFAMLAQMRTCMQMVQAAAVAERIPQLYLIGRPMVPAATAACVRLMHAAMVDALKGRYNEANAFLPPEIDEKFGRWLQRRFGWVRSWKAWGVRF